MYIPGLSPTNTAAILYLFGLLLIASTAQLKHEATISITYWTAAALIFHVAMNHLGPLIASAILFILGVFLIFPYIRRLQKNFQKLQAELTNVQNAKEKDDQEFRSETASLNSTIKSLSSSLHDISAELIYVKSVLKDNRIQLKQARNNTALDCRALKEVRDNFIHGEKIIMEKDKKIKELEEKLSVAQANEQEHHDRSNQVQDLEREIGRLEEQNAESLRSTNSLDLDAHKQVFAFKALTKIMHQMVKSGDDRANMAVSIFYELVQVHKVDTELLEINLGMFVWYLRCNRGELGGTGVMVGGFHDTKTPDLDEKPDRLKFVTHDGQASFACEIPHLSTLDEADEVGTGPMGDRVTPTGNRYMVIMKPTHPSEPIFSRTPLSDFVSPGSLISSGSSSQPNTTTTLALSVTNTITTLASNLNPPPKGSGNRDRNSGMPPTDCTEDPQQNLEKKTKRVCVPVSVNHDT